MARADDTRNAMWLRSELHRLEADALKDLAALCGETDQQVARAAERMTAARRLRQPKDVNARLLVALRALRIDARLIPQLEAAARRNDAAGLAALLRRAITDAAADDLVAVMSVIREDAPARLEYAGVGQYVDLLHAEADRVEADVRPEVADAIRAADTLQRGEGMLAAGLQQAERYIRRAAKDPAVIPAFDGNETTTVAPAGA